MDKIINLLAGNYMLKLETKNISNWCKVYFLDSQKGLSVFLGADDMKIICSRLCSALKGEKLNEKAIYKHGNRELFWILSLFEQHASIYGTLIDNFGIKIFCVEDGGEYLPELYLEKHDVESWISTLEKAILT